MSQKHFISSSPYTQQKHLHSGSPGVQQKKVVVPAINIKLNSQVTLNLVKNGLPSGAQSQRDSRTHYSELNKKKPIPSQKFTNPHNNNYIPGYYQNFMQTKQSSISKTQTSKELSQRKNNFDQEQPKPQKPKSTENKQAKLQTEPSQNHKSLSTQNIMSLIQKIKEPIRSKSPVQSSVESNFKQLLDNYHQTIKSKPGYQTDRTLYQGRYLLIQLYDGQNVTEYKFDSTCGTTDQVIQYLTLQCQNSQNIIGFATLDKNIAIDYYLSLKKKDLIPLDRQTIKLEPLFKEVDNGSLTLNSFIILQCIGMGGFSRVYLVRSKSNGRFLALKLISKQFIQENQKQTIVQNERDVMVQLNLVDQHVAKQFICSLECAFETKGWVCFGMEYCPGGELFNQLRRVKKMTEDQARLYFAEVVIAIGFLHTQYVLYRDIKPENILIDQNGHLKVADFGLARPNMSSSDEAYSFCGSPEYMAPEMLQQKGHTYAVDYYCLGALLFELLTGLPPFYSRDTSQIFKSILHENVQFPPNMGSPECKDLIRKLLAKNPEQRLGFNGGAEQILKHSWFSPLDMEDVIKLRTKPPFIPSLLGFNFDPSEFKAGDEKINQNEDNKFKPMFENFYFISDNLKQKRATSSKRPVTNVSQDCFPDKNYSSNNSARSMRRGNSSIPEKVEEMYKRVQMQNSLSSYGKSYIQTDLESVLSGFTTQAPNKTSRKFN
ncbi:hypothetical protein pb186bvf_011520 [Paramecium bursaria]